MAFTPSYLTLSKAELKAKINAAEKCLIHCTLCPRNCHIDRTAGELGFCRTGSHPFVSSWNPHFGEEAPLTGQRGSGTIFFTHCNLGCLFCQNWTVSHLGDGHIMKFRQLADIMLSLQNYGCHNINFVTPTHQVPQILKSLDMAIDMGLNIPLVYNCGGYESRETLRILDGIIDIYMPDFKFAQAGPGEEFAHAKNYPDIAKNAIREMHRQVGDLFINSEGIALRGLLVRHLVLPDGLADTEDVVKFLSKEISADTYTNIMDQYYPCHKASELPPLNRRVTKAEYSRAVDSALKAGLKRLDKH